MKPFGQVSIVETGGYSNEISQSINIIPEVSASIYLANARGQTIGEIRAVLGNSPTVLSSPFGFQLLNPQHAKGTPNFKRVVAHGELQLQFPQVEPVFNGPAVPFTITL